MSKEPTRRDVLGYAARGTGFLVLGGAAAYLTNKTGAEHAWAIDPEKCRNIHLGITDIEACDKCSTDCVLSLSAIRAVITGISKLPGDQMTSISSSATPCRLSASIAPLSSLLVMNSLNRLTMMANFALAGAISFP